MDFAFTEDQVAIKDGVAKLCAQFDDDLDDSSKINTNMAMTLSAPLNPLAHNTNFGWGVVLGGGYNMSPRHAIIGEFMWNRLQPPPESLTRSRRNAS